MRLIVEDNQTNEQTEGILVKKDESFIAIKIQKEIIRIYHWNTIKSIKRIYKGEKVEVNIESLRRGRE